MWGRALAVWFAILILAIANGALRAGWLLRVMSETRAYAASSLLLSLVVVAVTWLTIQWIAPPGPGDAIAVGLVWLAMTVAFEFLAGHYLFGQSWDRLLVDYRFWEGRIWVLVLLVVAMAPRLTASWPSPSSLLR